MWVKIKSEKIPNVVLTVPYSAFLNSYQRKGFQIVDNEKAKNKSTKEAETKIKISEQEKEMLEGLKADVEDTSIINEPAVETKVVEEIQEPVKETVVNKEETVEKQVKSSYAGRSPIKKAPNIKR